MRLPIRIEAVLLTLIVLGGSSLALLATPRIATPSVLEVVDLAQLSRPVAEGDRVTGRLVVDPAAPGDNTYRLTVLAADGGPLAGPEVAAIRLDLLALTTGAAYTVNLAPAAGGVWTARGSHLAIADWWRFTATIRRAGAPDAIVDFYLLMPDPNVNGNDAVPDVASEPDAEAFFQRGLARLTGLHRVIYVQQLTGGTGVGVETTHLVNDGSDGSVPSSEVSTATARVRVIGTTRWLQTPDGRWQATGGNPIVPPTEWGEDYTEARGFRLGPVEDVNGRQAQAITFFAPEIQGRAAAWYAWWIDLETGDVLRSAMISRSHYMVEEFFEIDGDVVIAEPAVDPAATPTA